MAPIQPHDENDLGTVLDGERMLDEVGIGQVDSILAAARRWPWGEICRRRRSWRRPDGTRRQTDRQQHSNIIAR